MEGVGFANFLVVILFTLHFHQDRLLSIENLLDAFGLQGFFDKLALLSFILQQLLIDSSDVGEYYVRQLRRSFMRLLKVYSLKICLLHDSKRSHFFC